MPKIDPVDFWRDGWAVLFFSLAGFFFGGVSLLMALLTMDEGGFFNMFGVCSIVGLGGGMVLLLIGGALFLRARRLKQIGEMIKGYQRIKVSNLAQKMNVSEFQAEQTITVCIRRNIIDGEFNRKTGEFMARNALKLKEMAKLLGAYRRVGIVKMAKKMNVNEQEALKMILGAIEENYIVGYFDRETGEFFTEKGLIHQRDITECPHCGAPVKKISLIGERLVCEACGSKL